MCSEQLEFFPRFCSVLGWTVHAVEGRADSHHLSQEGAEVESEVACWVLLGATDLGQIGSKNDLCWEQTQILILKQLMNSRGNVCLRRAKQDRKMHHKGDSLQSREGAGGAGGTAETVRSRVKACCDRDRDWLPGLRNILENGREDLRACYSREKYTVRS